MDEVTFQFTVAIFYNWSKILLVNFGIDVMQVYPLSKAFYIYQHKKFTY